MEVNLRKLSLLVVSVLLLVLASAPASAQDGTILDTAVATGDLSTLVAAVQAADPLVAETLNGPGPLTVFAPTNTAFSNLDNLLQEDFGITLEDVLTNEELVTNLLLYHVIQGAVFSPQVAELNGAVVPTLYPGTGVGITVNEDGSITLNGVADVVIPDVAATNGVVHVIDQVIFNTPLVEEIEAFAGEVQQAALAEQFGNSAAGVAASDPENFSTLLAVLEASGTTSLVNEGTPITVFAPTNAAFENLFAALGLTAEEVLAETELLAEVIRYHVVPEEVTSAQLIEQGEGAFRTFLNRASRNSGEFVTFEVLFPSFPDNGIELNGEAVITAVDIEADNGIVHVIDTVLLPDSVRETFGLAPNPSPDMMMGDDMDMGDDMEAEEGEDMATEEEAETEEAEDMATEEEAETEEAEDMEAEEEADDTATEEEAEDMDAEEEGEDMDAEETGDAGTIADIVVAATEGDPAEFTLLLQVVQAADPSILEALSSEGPITVFAPTDAAFEALLEQIGLPVEDVLAQGELLTQVLLYHVVPGAVTAEDVVALDGESVATLGGEDQTIAISVVDGGVVLNDSVNVVETDIMADNGVVHVIDSVLLPAAVMALLGM